MRCKFLHISDVHLGYQQYNHPERFNDFGRAFEHIVQRAVGEGVDFVLLAGDLFHKRAIDPPTLIQAVTALGRLKEARIPALAVEGNHERAHYRDVHSWVDFLTDQGYLITLNPVFENGRAALQPWDGERGAFIDLPIRGAAGAVRVYGAGYYGAATKHVVSALTDALAQADNRPADYAILMLHAGLDDVLPAFSATVPHSLLSPLKDYVNYLALGHIHKPYEREGWIFNPGSPETCSMAEAAWPDRGYYVVDVDTASDPVQRARRVANPRRPFVRASVNVDQCLNPDHLHALVDAEIEALARRSTDQKPVVEIALEGVLAFSGAELDLSRVQAAAEQGLNALLVRVANHTVPVGFEVRSDESLSRSEMERQVLEDLIERDARYGPAAPGWAAVAAEIKRMVMEDSSPESVVEHLRRRITDLVSIPCEN
jgi:DNA repair exonuclease SbcCD nuclease subunit